MTCWHVTMATSRSASAALHQTRRHLLLLVSKQRSSFIVYKYTRELFSITWAGRFKALNKESRDIMKRNGNQPTYSASAYSLMFKITIRVILTWRVTATLGSNGIWHRHMRRGAGEHVPPPTIIGNHHVQFWHFSVKYRVQYFVNFSYIYFKAKMSCPLKVDWAHTPMVFRVLLSSAYGRMNSSHLGKNRCYVVA